VKTKVNDKVKIEHKVEEKNKRKILGSIRFTTQLVKQEGTNIIYTLFPHLRITFETSFVMKLFLFYVKQKVKLFVPRSREMR